MKTLTATLVLGSVVANTDGSQRHVRLDLKTPNKSLTSAHLAMLMPEDEAKDFEAGEYSLTMSMSKKADKTGPVAPAPKE